MPRTSRTPLSTVPSFTGALSSNPPSIARQVYLLEPHPGTLCRVLDLYAARGIAVSSLQYEHAAPQTMMLTVTAHASPELLRVLVAKAGAQFGVIEAAAD